MATTSAFGTYLASTQTTWANTGNITGANNATFAVWTNAARSTVGTISTSHTFPGFDTASTGISVSATVWLWVSSTTVVSAATAQLQDANGVAIGAAVALTRSTTTTTSSVVNFATAPTAAQVAAGLSVLLTFTRSNSTTSTTVNVDAVSLAVTYTVPAPTAPVVSAGADTSIAQNAVFNRTGVLVSGSTPTSYSWTIVSGPDNVGTTLSTTASVSFAPTSIGVYTLRYSATSAIGTGTDDVIVTVTAPVTVTAITPRTATTDTSTVAVTALTLTKPADAVAGDILIASFSTNAANVSVVPTGWNLIANTNSTTQNNPRQFMYWRLLDSTDGAVTNYTWTLASAVAWGGNMQAFAGVDTTNPIDGTATIYYDALSTQTSYPVSYTTPTAKDMVVAALGLNTSTTTMTVTMPTGMTRDYQAGDTSLNAGKANVLGHYLNPSADTATYTWTLSAGRAGSVIIFALKPAIVTGGGGTTTGQVKVNVGGTWVAKPVKVNIGGTWVVKPAKFYNGSAWVVTPY